MSLAYTSIDEAFDVPPKRSAITPKQYQKIKEALQEIKLDGKPIIECIVEQTEYTLPNENMAEINVAIPKIAIEIPWWKKVWKIVTCSNSKETYHPEDVMTCIVREVEARIRVSRVDYAVNVNKHTGILRTWKITA